MIVRDATTPIDLGLTFANVSYNDAGTQYRPFGQSLDLKLLGYDLTNNRIVQSEYEGNSWSTHCDFVFPAEITQIGYLPDGEVVVAVAPADSGGSSIWRSTGWASNPLTATFVRTLHLPLLTYFAYGSVSVVGDIILCSEYGPQTNLEGSGATARRAYLSTNAGRSFTTVFDLNTTTVAGESGPWGGITQNQHLHGAAYDPWWNMLWLAVGDSGGSSIHGIIHRPLEGGSWQAVPYATTDPGQPAHWQSVLPYATEYGMLFGSDFDATGLRRVGRAGYRKVGTFGAAHVVDHGSGIRLIGREVYQAPGQPQAPVLFSFTAVGADYPGAVVAVTDRGRRCQTVYRDTLTVAPDNYRGVYRCIGPTNNGKFVIMQSDAGRYVNGSRAVAEIAPAASYTIP